MLRKSLFRLASPPSSVSRIGQGADNSLERDWVPVGSNICNLCVEPMSNRQEHIGKRDHLCLELFYNVIAEQARSWSGSGVAIEHDARFNVDVPMQLIFRHFDFNQLQRRNRIFALTRYLQDRGVVYLGPAAWRDGRLNKIQMGQNGAVAMFLAPHPQIIHLFPKADAAQIASFSQACYNQYSLETVFDFLGYGELIDARDLMDSGGGGGGGGGGSGNSENKPPSDERVLHWAHKAIIVRNVLGQIRFAMEGGHKLNHPISKQVEAHDVVLCEELAACLITEILYVRTCEFVTRADKVWRSHGCPMVEQPFAGTIRDISHHGIGPAFRQQQAKAQQMQNAALTSKSVAAAAAAAASFAPEPKSMSIFASSAAPTTSRNESLNSLRHPPGSRDHFPTSQTENATQMINACYHSAMNALLGHSAGDVEDRSGGEAFGEAEKSLRAPRADPRKMVSKSLRVLGEFRRQEEQERLRKKAVMTGTSATAAGDKKGSVTIVNMRPTRPPLSPVAEQLLRQASGLQQ